jgi:hypothetical protein
MRSVSMSFTPLARSMRISPTGVTNMPVVERVPVVVSRLRLYVDGALWKERTDNARATYYSCGGTRHRFQAWVTYVISFTDRSLIDRDRCPQHQHQPAPSLGGCFGVTASLAPYAARPADTDVAAPR